MGGKESLVWGIMSQAVTYEIAREVLRKVRCRESFHNTQSKKLYDRCQEMQTLWNHFSTGDLWNRTIGLKKSCSENKDPSFLSRLLAFSKPPGSRPPGLGHQAPGLMDSRLQGVQLTVQASRPEPRPPKILKKHVQARA